MSTLEAWEFLQKRQDAKLFDVRSSIEYSYVGHPIGAISVPMQEPPHWQLDTDFADKVRQYLIADGDIENEETLKSLPLLLTCRSGQRSMVAAKSLELAGFKELYNLAEGFEGVLDEKGHRSTINGWRFHNLPWQQS